MEEKPSKEPYKMPDTHVYLGSRTPLEVTMTINTQDETLLADYVNRYNDAILLCQPRVRRAMLRVPHDLMEMDEEKLQKKYPCKPVIANLRISFWEEYFACLRQEREFLDKNVYNRVCTSRYFYDYALESVGNICWLFRPTKNFAVDRQAILKRGFERLQEIMEMPLTDQNGKPLPAVGNLILHTLKAIEDRVEGAVVEKHEHVNLNLSANARDTQSDMKEIEEKIKALEAKELPKLEVANAFMNSSLGHVIEAEIVKASK